MNPVLTEISQQQKDSWNKFSGGWKKWDSTTMAFLQPMGEEMIRFLNPSGDQQILDVAGGTGEPGLTIAGKLNGGKVIITDIAENMLDVAKEKTATSGLKNIEFLTCDVSELPFGNETFDAVSCRFGFMFFPDMELAAKEMYRVLKPGGKIAASVWNIPEKNFWVTVTMGTIMKNMDLSPPPPESPGMFRCAKPGRMKEVFEKAGFRNYNEKEVTSKLPTGTVEKYWEMMTEVGAPIVAALSKADDAMRNKIKKEVFELIHQKYDPGNVNIDTSALVLTAEK
ncbi:MAG TPA: class I SAM-dependent methyltransferase [Chitinophagaceae bacterium]|nr:class I SAM-dependent methyltransferase [Chitinophagaceae bacterium]